MNQSNIYKSVDLEETPFRQKNVTGIVAINSIAFVEQVFNCYQNNQIVVLLREKNESRIQLTGITNVVEPSVKKGWFKQSLSFREDDALAQVSFTSGTEGEPKGVLLSYKALADVVQRLNHVMEVDQSIKEYVGVPAHYSFGLGRFRAVTAAGGGCIFTRKRI